MSGHTVSDVLRMAGHLLEEPKRRVSFAAAKDPSGSTVVFGHSRACRWCLHYALMRCASALNVSGLTALADAATELLDAKVGLINVWDGADEPTQDAIAAKLRAA